MNIGTLTNIAEIFGAVVGGIGAISAGIGYCYSQFNTGNTAATKDSLESQNELTQYMKDQIDGYKSMVEGQNVKITDMGKKLATMEALLAAKDKTIKEYMDIITNRNPELDQYMKESRQKWEDQKNIISQILDAMKNINAHMDKHRKDIRIDATINQP